MKFKKHIYVAAVFSLLLMSLPLAAQDAGNLQELYRNTKTQLDDLQNVVNDQRQVIASQKSLITQYQGDLKNAQENIGELEERYQSLKRLGARPSRSEQRIQNYQSRIESLQAELDSLREKNDVNASSREELWRENRSLIEQLEGRKKALQAEKDDNGDLQRRINELQVELKQHDPERQAEDIRRQMTRQFNRQKDGLQRELAKANQELKETKDNQKTYILKMVKAQAKVAELENEYNGLKQLQELDSDEKQSLSKKISELQIALRGKDVELKNLKGDYSQNQLLLERREADLQNHKQKFVEQEQVLDEFNAQMAKLEQQFRAEVEKTAQEKDLQIVAKQQAFDGQLREINAQLDELNRQNTSLIRQNESQAKQISKLGTERDKLYKQVQFLEKDTRELAGKARLARQELDSTRNDAQSQERKRSSLIEELRGELKVKQKQLQENDQTIIGLREELANMTRLEAQVSSIEQKKGFEIKKLQGDIQSLNSKLASAEEKIRLLTTEKKDLQSDLKSLDKEQNFSQKRYESNLRSKDKQYQKAQQDRVRLQDENQQLQVRALSAEKHLQELSKENAMLKRNFDSESLNRQRVAEQRQRLLNEVNILKSSKQDSLEAYNEVLSENKILKRQLEKAPMERDLFELEKELEKERKKVTKLSRIINEKEQAFASKVIEYEIGLEDREKDRHLSHSENKKLGQNLRRLEEALRSEQQKSQEKSQEIDQLKAEFRRITAEMEDQGQLIAENRDLKSELKEAQKELNEVNYRMKAQEAQLAQELASNNQTLRSEQEQVRDLRDKLNESQEALSNAQRSFGNLNTENGRLMADLRTLQSRLDGDLSSLEKENEQLKRQLTTLSSQLKSAQSFQPEQSTQAVVELKGQISQLEEILVKKENELMLLKASQGSKRAARGASQKALEEAQQVIADLNAQLAAYNNLERGSEKRVIELHEQLILAEKQTGDLKSELGDLRNVNQQLERQVANLSEQALWYTSPGSLEDPKDASAQQDQLNVRIAQLEEELESAQSTIAQLEQENQQWQNSFDQQAATGVALKDKSFAHQNKDFKRLNSLMNDYKNKFERLQREKKDLRVDFENNLRLMEKENTKLEEDYLVLKKKILALNKEKAMLQQKMSSKDNENLIEEKLKNNVLKKIITQKEEVLFKLNREYEDLKKEFDSYKVYIEKLENEQIRYISRLNTAESKLAEVKSALTVSHGRSDIESDHLTSSDLKALDEDGLKASEELDQGDLNSIGLKFYEQGEYDQAIDAFKRAIVKDKYDDTAYVNLGLCYAQKDQVREAVKNYLKALEYNPVSIPAYYNLGIAYYFNQQYQDAVGAYQKVIDLDPQHAAANYNLALVYQKLDESKAFEQWVRYLDLAEGRDDQQQWVLQAKDFLGQLSPGAA